jgi:hypothetical protein
VPATDRWAIAAYIRVLQEARPEVPEERFEAERVLGRRRAIPDPLRVPGMLPGEAPGLDPHPNEPGAPPQPH